MAKPEYSTFTNGMEYAKTGEGNKILFLLVGGPGNLIPRGFLFNLQAKPILTVSDIYTIYLISRKSNLPEGYTTKNMADDVAEIINQDFNGYVDAIIGLSYGGLVMQYFSAKYPELTSKHAIVAAAYAGEPESVQIDFQFAEYISQGKTRKAFWHISKGVYNGFIQKVMGAFFWLMGPMLLKGASPTIKQDIMVEAHAEVKHDGRDALPEIKVPVFLLNGDEDTYFSKEYITETAALIKDCQLVLIEGEGHTAFETKEAMKILEKYLRS